MRQPWLRCGLRTTTAEEKEEEEEVIKMTAAMEDGRPERGAGGRKREGRVKRTRRS